MDIPDGLLNKCASCNYWMGDRETVFRAYKENELSTDLDNGWMQSGECNNSHRFIFVEINGDAWIEVTFDPGYGCILWEPPEEE